MESYRFALLGFPLLAFLGSALGLACSSATGSADTTSFVPDGGNTIYVDLDGGGDAAVPPKGVTLCPSGACNYQSGSGCPSVAACLPTLNGSTPSPTCVPAGAVALGAACQATDDCVAGAVCATGICRKLCCGGDWTGCDDPSEHCIVDLEYAGPSGPVNTGAMVCYPINTCNALEPSSCTTSGTSCQIADATGVTACLPQGTGVAGQACPCEGGYICTEVPGSSPVCVRLCKAVEGGGEPACGTNEGVCTHYTRDPAGVGECASPN
jgi:hypothetical protein